MIIFGGIKFWSWTSGRTAYIWQCARCDFHGNFILRKGMQFITLYFIIPLIPVSKVKELVECPNCHARYEPGAQNNPVPSSFGTS